ncbi:MAG: hypothetical protein HFACDABA_01936 [Anaerolineales bacterium]|nr:hypothetical protein [Anaerolineales bacterium]
MLENGALHKGLRDTMCVAMNLASTSRTYYPQLDGLRFIAFLLVFLHNALPILSDSPLRIVSEYGWVGVDLFFCLSAGLIARLLVEEYRSTGQISIRYFYIRRALRIWPLYFFYVLAAIVIMAPIPGRNINIMGHMAGLFTFTFNFVYFALLPSPILILVHLWSISYEEQFYAVVPWVIRILANASVSAKRIVLIAGLLAGATMRAAFIYFELPHPWIYFLPFTHFESIFGGLIIGLGLLDALQSKIRGWAFICFGVLCLCVMSLLPNNDVIGWNLFLTYPLAGLAATAIVFGTLKYGSSMAATALSSPLLAGLGKISYGLYVFHFGCFSLAALTCINLLHILSGDLNQYAWLVLAIAFVYTVLFSILSYFLIEKRFLRLKDRFSKPLSHPL